MQILIAKEFLYRLLIIILFFAIVVISNVCALNIDIVKVCFLSGDYKAAINEGERFIAKDEYSSELHYLLGVSYLKEEDYQKSADNFKIVINNFKDGKFKEESRVGLADTYLLRGDFNNAQMIYRELIEENPKTKFKEQVFSRLNEIEVKKANGVQSDAASSYYSVQVGSFSKRNNAKNLAQKLISYGYPAYMEESHSVFRVKVGKLQKHSQAEELSKRLSSQGYPTKICP